MNKIGNWPTRALYSFVALAMVLSLVLMGAVLPTAGTTELVATEGSEIDPGQIVAVRSAEAGPDIPELLVYIERPTEGTSYNVDDTFYVNAVVAYKAIEGTYPSYEIVTATIDTGNNAALVTNEVPSKSATILRNCVGDFWWKVQCTGEGNAIITVTATASGLPNGQDSVTVIQGTPAPDCDLEITLIQPTGNDCYVDVCDNFVVKARVENKSSITATDVNVCIDIDPSNRAVVTGGEPLCWDVGDILVGKHVYVAWNLHCTADGAVDITVYATAGGVTNICPASVTVHQGEEPPEEEPPCGLDVTVYAPEEICTQGCGYNSYNVTATITNTCSDNCTNIIATISKIAGSGLASITPPLQQTVGTLMSDASQNVTWNVTCTGLGAVTFKVVAQGDEDDCVGEGTATVQQKRILIDLIEPEPGETIYHNICQTFNVTANITNCDCFGLQNVEVQLDLPDSVCITESTTIHITHYDQNGEYVDDYYLNPLVDLDDPERIPFPSFCACCIYSFEWIDLHCCDDTPDYGQTAEEVYIKVWDGNDNLMDSDYFLVMQTEKAHLAAGVEVYLGTSETGGPTPWDMSTTPATAIAVNQSFVVVIPVINMGMADAEDVSVNVTITGNATCAGNHTFNLGTIPGRTAKKAFISCNCTADGSVEIYISGLSGNDSIKKINHPTEPELYEIPESNIYDCGYRILKQIPITITIVQPDPGENFTCSDDFVVKVKVANESEIEGNDLTGVTATVTWTGYAEFNPGAPSGYATKDLGELEAGNHTYVAWNFHCYNTGNVVFTVTIESTDPVWSDYRTVTVHQIANATLAVEILSPKDGACYGTSEEFAVTAKVTVTAADLGFVENVWAYIEYCSALEVLGDTQIPLDTMYVGESQIVSWTVHAVKAGTQCATQSCPIQVEAGAPCAEWGYEPKTVTIYPAANLEVEITDAPEEVVVCETFDVTARVTNVGWADATGVKLLLSVIPDGSVRPVPGETYEELIGTLVGYGTGDYEEVTWTLHCKVACESTITITPVGYDECGWHFAYPLDHRAGQQDLRRENGGYVLVSLPGREIEDKFLTSDSVTVKQVEATQLVMDITFPADGAEFQEGDSFVVNGKVSNIGETTATGVTATLTVDPAASATITDAVKPLSNIAGGQAQVVSWTVECENAGYSLFTATAEATNADDALDTVTVKQGAAPAAQIVVDITYPDDGDEFFGGDEPDTFVVTAKVTNIGEQAATDVDVTIAIREGDPAALVTPPDATQTIASIPGGETKSVTWNLVAGETTGSAVITVTAVGPNTALDVVTVKINPAPVQMLFEGANPIAYQGETSYLPEALTNITDKLVIIWQRDVTTGGAWHRFYFYSGNPMGEIEKLVEDSAYIMVVSENCGWNLVH